MAKATKSSTTAKKPTASAAEESPAEASKGAKQARLEAEYKESYLANKKRVDEALRLCLKHFKNDEHEVVRIVAHMLHARYVNDRAKATPGGGPIV